MLDKAQVICLTGFLVAQFSLNSLYSPLMLMGWVGLAGASFCVYLGSDEIKRPAWVFNALIFLQISQLLAVPGSYVWGNGNWVLTAGVVLWTLPMPLVYLAVNRQIERCMCTFAIVHAFTIIVQGFTNYHWVGDIVIREGSPTGFSHNPNLAAGLLVMCLPFTIKGRWLWASIPLLAAIIFTGSRWAFIVAGIIVLSMGYKNVISLKWVLGGVLSLLGGIVIMGMFTPFTAAVESSNSIAEAFTIASQIEVRLGMAGWPNLLPYGIAETDGLHNVPMRMAAEFGVISAAIWIALTIWALTKHRYTPAWWLMIAVALLSILDHYTWRPHLMGFWFVALGLLSIAESKSIPYKSS